MDLETSLSTLVTDACTAVTAATDERALDEVRVRYLGKKG